MKLIGEVVFICDVLLGILFFSPTFHSKTYLQHLFKLDYIRLPSLSTFNSMLLKHLGF